MREGRWRFLPPVVQPVDGRDWHFGKFFLRDALQAADVHAVHLADGSVIADAKARTPQCLQKKCWFFFVLKRYSVISPSPASRRKFSGLATATQNRFLLQMEQLHRYVLTVKSRSASNRTAPQWHLPWFVFKDTRGDTCQTCPSLLSPRVSTARPRVTLCGSILSLST